MNLKGSTSPGGYIGEEKKTAENTRLGEPTRFPKFAISGLCLACITIIVLYFFFTPTPAGKPTKTAKEVVKSAETSELQAYRNEGQFREGIAHLTDEINKNPRAWPGYFNRGNVYYHAGHYDEAISDFNKVLGLGNRDSLTYYSRGRAYAGKGQYDEAISDFDKALERDSRNASAYNERGGIYHRKREYERAISDFSKALEINPSHALSLNNRGRVYYDLGQYEKAIADYNRALEVVPNYALALRNRELAFAKKDQSGVRGVWRWVAQYWPALLLITVFALYSYLFYLVWRKEKRKADRRMREWLSKTGLAPLTTDPVYLLTHLENFEVFSQKEGREDRRIKNVFGGICQDIDVKMFDYYYRACAEGPFKQLVVLLRTPVLSLPPFLLCPRGLSGQLKKLFSSQAIDFKDHPKFSKDYMLFTKSEATMRLIFTPGLISFFEKHKGINMEGYGDEIVLYNSALGNQLELKTPEIFGYLVEEGLNIVSILKTR